MDGVPTSSVVTLDMINMYAAQMGVSLEDGTQYPGVIGSLLSWENGQGEIPAFYVNEPVFAPLVAAYTAAKEAAATTTTSAPVDPVVTQA